MNILFLISIILVIFSSLLITFIFENKKIYKAICYFAGTLFAQIVITFEILSLKSAIFPKNILILNLIFAILAFFLWKKYGNNPKFSKDILSEYNKLLFAIKSDKWLKCTGIAFFVFLFGSLMYVLLMPANDGDALSYHLARLPFWYENHNINHFICSDIRALIMPINSEIFYFWAYSFIKSDFLARTLSFLSYFIFILTLRGFLKEINVTMKISLWAIFALTAFHNIMLSISETDSIITISALILSSLYLFLLGLKNNNKKDYYFASLLYALAIGTKTPALQAAPAFLFICTIIAFLYKKKDFYKPLLICSAFLIINTLLFGAYNYILNFIDFGNPLTSTGANIQHQFTGGIKAFIANIIRYSAMFVDFSGFPFNVFLWRINSAITMLIIALLNIDPDICTVNANINYFTVGNNFANMSGMGVLGILIFVPALIMSFKRIKHSFKSTILGLFAVGFIINFLILASTLGYMIFSIRFIMFFVLIASPVIIYPLIKFNNKPFKKFIAVIIIYTLTFSYYFYEKINIIYLSYIFYKYPSVQKFKQHMLEANENGLLDTKTTRVIKRIKNDNDNLNVLYFASSGSDIYSIKHLQNQNFKVDIKLLETTEENDIDFEKYNYILVPQKQFNTNVQNIFKYKNAITFINQNGQILYKYPDKFFADCIFINSRDTNYNWLNDSPNKITESVCTYKSYIIEKHGFTKIAKENDTDEIGKEITDDRIETNPIYIYKKIGLP